jgi:CRP/FNR family transcriptional regulator
LSCSNKYSGKSIFLDILSVQIKFIPINKLVVDVQGNFKMDNVSEIVNIGSVKNKCKHCHAVSYCLSGKLDGEDLKDFTSLVKQRKPICRGERLFQSGNLFTSIYVVHTGSIKTYIESSDGEQQITGFYFPGDIIGIDAFDTGYHSSSAETLEPSSFCEMSVNRFKSLVREIPSLQHEFFCHISREIKNEQALMLLLGKMNSKRRLATFLLKMSDNIQIQGGSSQDINLKMTRHDIANYLGLAIETVSRLFTNYQNSEILGVNGRNIIIKNKNKLQSIAENCPEIDLQIIKRA